MRVVIAFAAAAALAAISSPVVAQKSSRQARGEQALAKILAGRVAGKPVNCISLNRIQSTEIIDGTAIVYRESSRRLFVNRTLGGQNILDRDAIMVTRTFGTQLCRLDTVRLVDRGSRIPRGTVGLGDFVPYTRPATAR